MDNDDLPRLWCTTLDEVHQLSSIRVVSDLNSMYIHVNFKHFGLSAFSTYNLLVSFPDPVSKASGRLVAAEDEGMFSILAEVFQVFY